jgi:hypothetical protein
VSLNNTQTPGAISDGITVSDGNNPAGFNSNWVMIQSSPDSTSAICPGGEGLYTNIQSNQGYGQMTMEMELISKQDNGTTTVSSGSSPVYSIYANASGTIIPINLWNATSFNESYTPVTYSGDLATFNNTCTYNMVALNTYGNGLSNVTFTFVQQLIANWTVMTVHMYTIVDLTNTTFYNTTSQQALPAGTPFSFNFVYTIDMSNYTESQAVGHFVGFQPTSITPTGVYFQGNYGTGYQYNIADMNFGDTYSEVNNSALIPNQNAEAFFQNVSSQVQGTGAFFVLCYQTFPNLTMGYTTLVQSDPTFETYFTEGSSSFIPPSILEWIIPVIAGAAVVVVVAVFVVRKHKQRVIPQTETVFDDFPE